MLTRCFVLMVLVLFSLNVDAYERLNITSLADDSAVIVYGEVESLNFVWREDIPPQFTTDVTVRIENLIKGESNSGDNHVVFMIRGGTGTDPITGNEYVCEVSNTPDFKIGEKVLLFLSSYAYDWAERKAIHNGLCLAEVAKRSVKDESVVIPYTTYTEDDRNPQHKYFDRPVNLPLDLALNIAKMAALNPAKSLNTEEKIRGFAKATPYWKPDGTTNLALNDVVLGEVKKEVDAFMQSIAEVKNDKK